MKIAKQMLRHLDNLHKKSFSCRAYSDLFTVHLESPFVSAASKTLTVPR